MLSCDSVFVKAAVASVEQHVTQASKLMCKSFRLHQCGATLFLVSFLLPAKVVAFAGWAVRRAIFLWTCNVSICATLHNLLGLGQSEACVAWLSLHEYLVRPHLPLRMFTVFHMS